VRQRAEAAGVRAWTVFFAVLALVARLPFLFGRHGDDGGDALSYLHSSDALLHGHGYQSHRYWTPGYPVIEAVLHLLPGRTMVAVTVAQHLLGVALVVAILVVAWRYFGRATALTAATLAAITPVMVVHEHTLLPDFVFGVVVFAGTVCLAEAVRRPAPPWRLLALTGFVFGVAAWIKPAGEFLFVAAVPALAFATRDVRATLRGSAVVALVLLLTVSPWVIRNTVRFDLVAMSDQGGRALSYRAFDRSHLPIPVDADYGRLARTIAADPRAALPPPDPVVPWFYSNFQYALEHHRGLSEEDAGAVQQRLALTAIRRHPSEYARDSWHLFRVSLTDIRRFTGSQALRNELHYTGPPLGAGLTPALWRLGRLLTGVWWLVSLHLIAGLLLLFVGSPASRRAAACLLSVWLVLALGSVLSEGGEWRYSIQLAATTWILGSAGAVLVASGLWRGLAARRVAVTA
jgi:4-amino-4-deoxy-L-arabinose transferase-like glycosyltransferase